MAVTNFIWDPLSDNVISETDENDATVAAYTHKPGLFGKLLSQDRSGATSSYHYDGKHSARQLTDDNQDVTDTVTYSAFGEIVAKTGVTTNPFGYKGAVGYYTNSETDDLYVRARTYQPSSGRWFSEDPAGYIDGPNLYRAYFVPNGLDPKGLNTIDFFPCSKVADKSGVIPTVFVSYPTILDFPIDVYKDPLLDDWWDDARSLGINAFNNLCYRIDADCKDGVATVRGIEFHLALSIPKTLTVFDRGLYGHEQEHQKQITIGISKLLAAYQGGIKKFLCDLNGACNCAQFAKSLEEEYIKIWKAIGPFYVHRDYGGPGPADGRPFMPFDLKGRPMFPPAIRNIPDRPESPKHHEGGWVCPMDDALKGKGKFPDWQFGNRKDKHPTKIR